MARARIQIGGNPRSRQQVGTLRKLIRNVSVPESDLCRPESPTAVESTHPALNQRTERGPCPPEGWPDDEGWANEAEVLQGLMGEDPQV